MQNKSDKKILTTTTLEEIHTTPQQLDLNLNPVVKIKQDFKLSINQINILQVMALNIRAFSPSDLKKLCNIQGINCVSRFMARAKNNGWIRELKIIPGTTVNNLFAYYKEPDTLENGQEIKDSRHKYYQITDLGIKVFEINEKSK